MNAEEIIYVTLANSAVASSQTSNTATFTDVSIAAAPLGFEPTSILDFSVYINGQFVPRHEIVSITESGNDIVVVIDTVALQYEILPDFEVLLVGKLNNIV